MKRSYTHLQVVESELIFMKQEGKTTREIAEYFGLKDKFIIKRWVSRYNQRKKRAEAGILPKRRGRPPRGYVASEQELTNQIKQLQMENELLRNFLQLVGRR